MHKITKRIDNVHKSRKTKIVCIAISCIFHVMQQYEKLEFTAVMDFAIIKVEVNDYEKKYSYGVWRLHCC